MLIVQLYIERSVDKLVSALRALATLVTDLYTITVLKANKAPGYEAAFS